MESLRDAAQAARIVIDRERAAEEIRQQVKEQEARTKEQSDRAEHERKVRESSQRAQEFITIMREKSVPVIEYHSATRSESRDRSQAPCNEGETETWQERKLSYNVKLDVPPITGWLAMRPYRTSVQNGTDYDMGGPIYSQITLPGVFVSQDGQTYISSAEMKFHGQDWVVNYGGEFGKPDPTLLAGDKSLDRMATRLAINGHI